MSSIVLGGFVRLLFGLGMGFTAAPATESIMGSLPPGKAGVGSAVNDTTRQTGGALGVAVIGSIFALRYHASVTRVPGVPGTVQAQIRDSIGKALVAAQRLPAQEQRLVRAVADHAYILSMRLAFAVGATVILAAAVVSWRWLPARAQDEPTIPDEEPLAEALAIVEV
jgi:MFS family permease